MEKGKAGRVDYSKYLDETTPSYKIIMPLRLCMGIGLVIMGIIAVTAMPFLKNSTTILATQTPAADDHVGMALHPPASNIVARFKPLLSIGVSSLIFGVLIAISSRAEKLQIWYIRGCEQYSCYFSYYQVCFQSGFVILTIMPLSGVINVYELVFATALTFAEFWLYLCSDLTNALVLNNWEFVDTIKIRHTPNDPAADYFRLTGRAAWFTNCYQPLLGAIVTHMLIWIIILIHVIESARSSVYEINSVFIVIIALTMFLQMLIPVFKLIQLARPSSSVFHGFRMYRFVLMAVEMTEFANMVVVTTLLIFAIK